MIFPKTFCNSIVSCLESCLHYDFSACCFIETFNSSFVTDRHQERSDMVPWVFWLNFRRFVLEKLVGCSGLPRDDVQAKFQGKSVD